MIRLIAVLGSILCFAIVLGEAVGLGLLWTRGRLTPDVIRQVRSVLAGEARDATPVEEDEDRDQPSSEEVIAERAMRVLDLESREAELEQLKALVTESRTLVLQEHEKFTTEKKTFQEELDRLSSQFSSQATELTREVLAQSEPKEAVRHLMALDLERDIVLIKGLSEKRIAELLKEFSRGDAEQIDRGLKIFEALGRGEPTKTLVDKARNTLSARTDTPTTQPVR